VDQNWCCITKRRIKSQIIFRHKGKSRGHEAQKWVKGYVEHSDGGRSGGKCRDEQVGSTGARTPGGSRVSMGYGCCMSAKTNRREDVGQARRSGREPKTRGKQKVMGEKSVTFHVTKNGDM